MLDDLADPVSGADVTGDFGGTLTETGAMGTTGPDGTVTITTAGTARGGVSVSFCVSNVVDVIGGLPYLPGSSVGVCAP